MEETEKRELIAISPEWSIPQLQEKIADAITGDGPALATAATQIKFVSADTCLVVNTSGSTGEANSVAISTAALIASTNAAHKYLGAVPGDAWSLLLPTEHIAGLNVIARATALGTKVIDNRKVAEYVDADFISIVPTQLHRALTSDAKLLEHLTAAEAVLVGGGPISDALKKQAADKHVKVVTTYGMTEMCGGCVYNQKPLDGVEIEINSAGLVKLKAPMMASNYLNNPALWQSLTPDGWFQTSDLGELVNGKLNVLGRADDVINSGGEKISLTAVESLFNSLPIHARNSLLELFATSSSRHFVELASACDEFKSLWALCSESKDGKAISPFRILATRALPLGDDDVWLVLDDCVCPFIFHIPILPSVAPLQVRITDIQFKSSNHEKDEFRRGKMTRQVTFPYLIRDARN
jgi:O-succinylbenzoic acid--CoA ligase